MRWWPHSGGGCISAVLVTWCCAWCGGQGRAGSPPFVWKAARPLMPAGPPAWPAPCSRLPRARWLITTLGSRGSVLLERGEAAEAVGASGLEDLLPQLFEEAAATQAAQGTPQSAPACVSASGVAIHTGGSASTNGVLSLRLQRSEAESQRVMAAAQAAASAAAAANADAGNAAGYAMRSPWPRATDGGSGGCGAAGEVCARVTAVQAARLPPGAVVDTTGAGDAFIGSILYGLATGMPVQRAMQLASVVAACKCTALGPRPGLPHRANLAASLLGS